MAKFTIGRIFEASRLLSTEAGQQIKELITYSSEAFEQIIRGLKGGLTFEDNFNCRVSLTSFQDGVSTAVYTANGIARGVIPLKVASTTVGIDAFTWYVGTQNELMVKIDFTGSPTSSVDVTLLILF